MSQYSKIAKYYDMIQRRLVDYDSEILRLKEIFSRNNVKTVLDITCGTGTHLIGLAKFGFQCTGQDASPEMVNVAQEKASGSGLSIDFRVADMRHFRFDRKYDSVICLYSLSNLGNENDVASTLQEVSRVLSDGGLFVFNVINAECAFPLLPLSLEATIEENDIKIVLLSGYKREGNLAYRNTIHLIEDKGFGLEIIPLRMIMYEFDVLERTLLDYGLKVDSVYSSLAELHRWEKESFDLFVVSKKH